MDETAELLSRFNRELKYEVLEEELQACLERLAHAISQLRETLQEYEGVIFEKFKKI